MRKKPATAPGSDEELRSAADNARLLLVDLAADYDPQRHAYTHILIQNVVQRLRKALDAKRCACGSPLDTAGRCELNKGYDLHQHS